MASKSVLQSHETGRRAPNTHKLSVDGRIGDEYFTKYKRSSRSQSHGKIFYIIFILSYRCTVWSTAITKVWKTSLCQYLHLNFLEILIIILVLPCKTNFKMSFLKRIIRKIQKSDFIFVHMQFCFAHSLQIWHTSHGAKVKVKPLLMVTWKVMPPDVIRLFIRTNPTQCCSALPTSKYIICSNIKLTVRDLLVQWRMQFQNYAQSRISTSQLHDWTMRKIS